MPTGGEDDATRLCKYCIAPKQATDTVARPRTDGSAALL